MLNLPDHRTPVALFHCKRWPGLRIRHLEFKGGELPVYSETDANLVRIAHGYGVHISEVPVVGASSEPLVNDPAPHHGTMTSAGSEARIENADGPVAEAKPTVERRGGWYVWQGKNYRKRDLPPEAAELLE